MFFNFYNYFLSIKFLSNSKVKLIILQKQFLSWQLKNHLEGSVQAITEEIQKLPLSTGVFLSLEPKDIVLKISKTKIKNHKHIRSVTAFQLEPKLPCAAEDSALQIAIYPQKNTQTTVLSFITRKEKVENLILNTQQLNVFPDSISASTIDSVYLVNKILPKTKHQTFFLIQMNQKECCCFLIKKNLPLGNRSFSHTKNDDRNCLEIKHTFAHFKTKNPEENPELVISWNLPIKLKQKLEQELNLNILSLPKPIFIKNLNQDLWEEAGDMIATIVQATENKEINFLKTSKKFSLIFRNQIKRMLPSFLKIGVLFAIICAFINISQMLRLKKKATESLFLIEKQFDLPQENFSGSLENVQKRIQKHKRFLERNSKISLIPNTPKISHLIHWLSCNKDLKDVNFSINSLHYHLETYPDHNNKQNKYLTKFYLRGELNNPESGKRLLQILKYANPYKDAKKPIEWEQKDTLFTVIFYLQDQTPY